MDCKKPDCEKKMPACEMSPAWAGLQKSINKIDDFILLNKAKKKKRKLEKTIIGYSCPDLQSINIVN